MKILLVNCVRNLKINPSEHKEPLQIIVPFNHLEDLLAESDLAVD
jgi:hypothetical protein